MYAVAAVKTTVQTLLIALTFSRPLQYLLFSLTHTHTHTHQHKWNLFSVTSKIALVQLCSVLICLIFHSCPLLFCVHYMQECNKQIKRRFVLPAGRRAHAETR